jgi:hypothetical protein
MPGGLARQPEEIRRRLIAISSPHNWTFNNNMATSSDGSKTKAGGC